MVSQEGFTIALGQGRGWGAHQGWDQNHGACGQRGTPHFLGTSAPLTQVVRGSQGVAMDHPETGKAAHV